MSFKIGYNLWLLALLVWPHLDSSHQHVIGTNFCSDLGIFSLDSCQKSHDCHASMVICFPTDEQGLVRGLFWIYSSDWLWVLGYTSWVHTRKDSHPTSDWTASLTKTFLGSLSVLIPADTQWAPLVQTRFYEPLRFQFVSTVSPTELFPGALFFSLLYCRPCTLVH